MIKINTKYYNRSNNFQSPVKREPKPYNPYSYRSEVIVPTKQETAAEANEEMLEIKKNERSISVRELSLKTDDLLLIGLIILLLPNAKDNLLLILILGYLLLTGIDG